MNICLPSEILLNRSVSVDWRGERMSIIRIPGWDALKILIILEHLPCVDIRYYLRKMGKPAGLYYPRVKLPPVNVKFLYRQNKKEKFE